jgi:phosphoribosyl-ATP pyrophosphohydrolase/phosphoribosyl-AMP cyclohydrolase/histidinol dehydrogenase
MFGERAAHEPLVRSRADMREALGRLDAPTRAVLERTAKRIESFARLQREALRDLDVEVPAGRAGHTIEPMDSAGCYAPGGRYPLPSSVLMTAIAARAAGVRRVVVASPNASDVMLGAAAIAGADEFLCAGGAHAIGALAYGVDGLAPCDVIVGPGNRWVTAAKRIVGGDVAIDMLAGPSELVVIADDGADPEIVAADLLAQAEHDPDATAGLITTSDRLARIVDEALERRLRDLPTGDTARRSLLDRGFVCVVETLDEAANASDAFAPEHLQLSVRDPDALRSMIRHAGAVFVGERTAEVFGDYGVGPNHTLPTGGAARRSAGLSVMHFLRVRTWIRMDNTSDLSGVIRDAASMARIEGLEAHARAAETRLTSP